jgi:hypothetical protein
MSFFVSSDEKKGKKVCLFLFFSPKNLIKRDFN